MLLGCAPSAAEAWAAALEPGLALPVAMARCDETGDRAESCRAEVIRAHPEAEVGDCSAIHSAKWRAECSFTVAEKHARKHERWQALSACGQAGTYYAECLYHAWTYEMQAAVRGGGRANDEVESGRELVAYWGQLQTIAGSADAQMWNDWWYFALKRNPPAKLADCADLPAADAATCERGTLAFAERAVATAFTDSPIPAHLKSRACRGEVTDLEAVFPKLYVPDERMRERALTGRTRGCTAKGNGLETGRSWNPIFLEHRQWPGG